MYTYEKYGHVVRKYSQSEIVDAIENHGVKYQCSWCGTLYTPDEQKNMLMCVLNRGVAGLCAEFLTRDIAINSSDLNATTIGDNLRNRRTESGLEKFVKYPLARLPKKMIQY